MSIKIGGNSVTKYVPKSKLLIKPTIDNSLTSGLLTLVNYPSGEAFEPYTEVEIEEDSSSEIFLIDGDKSSLSNIKAGLYTHSITLLEYTAKLENYTMPNLTAFQTVSGTKKTMYDQVERIIAIFNSMNHDGDYIYIDTSVDTILSQYTAFQIQLSKPTLREALDTIFESEGYLVVLKNVSGNDTIYIDNKNIEGDDISSLPYVYEEYETNSNDYATSLEIEISNAIVDNREDGVNTVNKIRYSLFSTLNGDYLTTDNASLVTQKPIESIVKYEMIHIGGDSSNAYVLTTDLTDRIYDKREWLLLSEVYSTSTHNQQNTLYYEYGGYEILNWYYDPGFFSDNVLTHILEEEYPSYTDFNTSTTQILHNLEYIANDKLNMRVETGNISSFDNRKVKFFNQSDNQVDSNRLGAVLYNTVKRYGNPTLKRRWIVDTLDDVPSLGDYIGSYVLSIVEAKKNANSWTVEGTLSKDYVAINSRIAVDSQKRIYDIPLTGIERNQILKTQLAFSKTNTTNVSQLSSNALNVVLDTFKSGALTGRGIGVSIATTKDSSYTEINQVALDVNVFPAGYSIVASFGFKDNYSAGRQITGSVTGGKGLKDVSYVDGNGEFLDITWEMYNDLVEVDFTDTLDIVAQASLSLTYPAVTDAEIPLTSEKLITGTIQNYYKDRGEHSKFSQQIEFLNKTDFKIGRYFIENNALLKDQDYVLGNTFTLFATNKIYGDNEYIIDSADFEQSETGASALSRITALTNKLTIDIPTLWELFEYNTYGIAYSDDGVYKLYLALNQTNGVNTECYLVGVA